MTLSHVSNNACNKKPQKSYLHSRVKGHFRELPGSNKRPLDLQSNALPTELNSPLHERLFENFMSLSQILLYNLAR